MKRVLLGSCGGLTGIYLAKRYRRDSSLYVVGADCSEVNAGRHFVDDFVLLPRTSDPFYIEALVNVLCAQSIDYYIPTYSTEIKNVSEYENELRTLAPTTSFVVCPSETFLILDDKRRMHKAFSEAGLPIPKLFSDVEDAEFPCFMKRRVGSGGFGCALVKTRQMYSALSMNYPDALFFEFVDGEELTIDCMFDTRGSLISYNQRKRIKTLGGAAIISKNDYSVDMNSYLQKIAANWIFKGCVNFQCIVHNGQPFFTDVNLRFPSGGLPLTVESGIDVPRLLIELLSGEDLKPSSSDRLPRTMYRYFEEFFTIE